MEKLWTMFSALKMNVNCWENFANKWPFDLCSHINLSMICHVFLAWSSSCSQLINLKVVLRPKSNSLFSLDFKTVNLTLTDPSLKF